MSHKSTRTQVECTINSISWSLKDQVGFFLCWLSAFNCPNEVKVRMMERRIVDWLILSAQIPRNVHYSQDKGFRDKPHNFHPHLFTPPLYLVKLTEATLKSKSTFLLPLPFPHDATVLYPKNVDLGFGGNDECRGNGSKKSAFPT